ncbi:hypothetical protein ACIGXM_22390 [Kitasatospora sp. NPDC052896]|uniref:hypothetical protein n=1 Tax=Kitasatospora sp. NPDC052896 TaxID=3364061 RepID=UPI0037CA9000
MVSSQAARTDPTPAAEARRRTTALRRQIGAQLLFELVLPLGSYYGLRAAGTGQWLAMVVSGLLLPWIGYGIVRQRWVNAMALFSLIVRPLMWCSGPVPTLPAGVVRYPLNGGGRGRISLADRMLALAGNVWPGEPSASGPRLTSRPSPHAQENRP